MRFAHNEYFLIYKHMSITNLFDILRPSISLVIRIVVTPVLYITKIIIINNDILILINSDVKRNFRNIRGNIMGVYMEYVLYLLHLDGRDISVCSYSIIIRYSVKY